MRVYMTEGLNLCKVAEILGTSSRTLQRRLRDSDTSFSRLLDEVRSGEAGDYGSAVSYGEKFQALPPDNPQDGHARRGTGGPLIAALGLQINTIHRVRAAG